MGENLSEKLKKRTSPIDINPKYLAALYSRFHESLPGLELEFSDLEEVELKCI